MQFFILWTSDCKRIDTIVYIKLNSFWKIYAPKNLKVLKAFYVVSDAGTNDIISIPVWIYRGNILSYYPIPICIGAAVKRPYRCFLFGKWLIQTGIALCVALLPSGSSPPSLPLLACRKLLRPIYTRQGETRPNGVNKIFHYVFKHLCAWNVINSRRSLRGVNDVGFEAARFSCLKKLRWSSWELFY